MERTNLLRRRRTDGDGRDWERRARRRVAETAYRLFVGLGCDRAMEQECWRAAEQWIVGDDAAARTPAVGSVRQTAALPPDQRAGPIPHAR